MYTGKISLGAAPACEECVQLLTGYQDQYLEYAREECERYVKGILSFFGPPPFRAVLEIIECAHDYGTYLEVFVLFDGDNEEAATWAQDVDNRMPGTWAELEGTDEV
jgi:hypothetical protein